MLLGAVADDLTGASDLANTLSTGGMRTMLFVGADSERAPADCEAGVVALKTRSIAPAEAVNQSLDAARWLLDQGCRQLLFKYCSTFDSTPEGNIGPVAEALLELAGAAGAIVCPAFPRAGRRVFMGHLFVGDRLLNESGMENHPLTPMTDADIRRWLARQSRGRIGHIPLATVRAGADALREFVDNAWQRDERLLVMDAIDEQDLETLGVAAAGHRLVTGSSAIALALPRNFRAAGLLAAEPPPLARPAGPGIVLCGSCSETSRAQVEAYGRTAPWLAIDPDKLLSGQMTVERAYAWVRAQSGAVPMIFSTMNAATVASTQARFGARRVADAIEQFFGELARRLVDAGVRRLVVGGGETSGAVMTALGVRRLWISREIDTGVPALVAERDGLLGLALKSGNFGQVDFFSRALQEVGNE